MTPLARDALWIAADTYDIIVTYEDGVLSVSKWLLLLVVGILLSIVAR